MNLPDECWGHIHTFLYINEFCWPVNVLEVVRQKAAFSVRLSRAKPLYKFQNLYRGCVVEDCDASRGAFRDFVVSPYCVQHACQWSCPRILFFRIPDRMN